MGAWGHAIFQSDSELDLLAHISDRAKTLANDQSVELFKPPNSTSVAEKLNNGLFHTLVTHFVSEKRYRNATYLAAASMALGVKINDEERQTLRAFVNKFTWGIGVKGQVVQALEGYTNDGTPWDFESEESLKMVEKVDEGDESPDERVDG